MNNEEFSQVYIEYKKKASFVCDRPEFTTGFSELFLGQKPVFLQRFPGNL
jgi:hypothetical protein